MQVGVGAVVGVSVVVVARMKVQTMMEGFDLQVALALLP